MRLAIYSDSRLVVSAPRWLSETSIEKFLLQKAEWILHKLDLFKNRQPRTVIKNSRHDYLKYKEPARQLILERINYFNQFYNFSVNRVAVRKQRTRWGSCSIKGNLNFNYRLIFLPSALADYIIVHELCHLEEFNHSKKFWDLVSRTIPEYKSLRKELRKVASY